MDFDTDLAAVDEVRILLPDGMTMTQMAMRWILMIEVVTCASGASLLLRSCGMIWNFHRRW
jgi:hypothetical protein